MKKFVVALSAALCLFVLAGCGGKGEIKEGMYFEASGISPDTILLTVNDQDVPAERYLYWLRYNCEYTVDRLDSVDWAQVRTIAQPEAPPAAGSASADAGDAGSTEEKDKEKEKPLEQTLDEYVKEMALSNTALYTIVQQWATLHAVELTAEDRTAIAQDYQNNCDANGGEEAYLASLAKIGVSRALAESYSQDYYLYKRLYEFSQQADSPLAPTAEALAAFADTQQLHTVDYIFVSTKGVENDPAELAKRRERAQMVLEQLNAKTNPPADFYMIMEAYSDRKDFPSGGITFAPGESGLGDTIEKEAARLQEWQYTEKLIEGPDGFYVLRGRALDPDLLSSLYFDQTLSDAVTAADIATKRPYKKLSAEEFYNNMLQLQETGSLSTEEEKE